MRFLLFILLFCSLFANSQTILDTTFVTWKAKVFLPADWNGNADSSRQCIVFSYGAGQVSPAAYTVMDDYGPMAYLVSGWNGGITLGNGTHYPVIIGLQQSGAWMTSGQALTRLNAIRARYKIKASNLHVSGWSAGGHTYKIMATEDSYDSVAPFGPFTYASAFKSIVDVQGVLPDDNGTTGAEPWFQKVKNFARNGVTGGGKYLGIWGTADGDRSIPRFRDTMNAVMPGSAVSLSTSDGHNSGAVDRVFGSLAGAAPQAFTIGGSSMTVYQWMLRQGDTTLSSGNANPVANAGADQTITLPTSSVTLNGSGTDADGTVVSYAWTKISGTGGAITSSSSATTTVTGLSEGSYQFQLLVTDNLGATGTDLINITVNPAPATANAGADTTVYINQTRPDSVYLNGALSSGSTFTWSLVDGPNTPTIISSSSQNSWVVGLVEGNYRFRILVNGTVSDTTSVFVRDWMKKGQRPCRAGVKQSFTLTQSGGEVYQPYITRDNILPSLLGGDTIYIQGGTFTAGVELGDFGGSEGCPIVIAAKDIPVTITSGGFFRLGARDSNMVSYVKVDGTTLRGAGYPYGFVSTHTVYNGEGFTANNVHHLEVTGISVNKKAVGVLVKKNSTVYIFSQYDKMLLRGIKIHDNYIRNVEGEGLYIGHTDNTGTQVGNSSGYGPPPRGDSLEIYNNIIDSTGWDGIQVSNFLNGVKVYDNFVHRTGQTNASSQQHPIIIGSNINAPQAYRNTMITGTGGFGLFSYGAANIYNNVLYNIATSAGEEGMYLSRNNAYPETLPALSPIVTGNIIKGSNSAAVFTSYTPTTSGGSVTGNYFLGNGTNGVDNNSGATVSGNITTGTFNVTVNNISQTATGYSINMTANGETATFTSTNLLNAWLINKLFNINTERKFKRSARYYRIISN